MKLALAIAAAALLAGCGQQGRAPGSSDVTAPLRAEASCEVSVAAEPLTAAASDGSFQTGDGAEATGCLPNNWPAAYTIVPVYALTLTGLHAGDVVQLSAEFEVTNDSGVTMMVGAQLALSDGTALTERNTGNVTAAMHHFTVTKAATWRAREDGDVTIQVLAWAATDAIRGGSLKVERGYGALQGAVLEAK